MVSNKLLGTFMNSEFFPLKKKKTKLHKHPITNSAHNVHWSDN